jgi:hypothetical protein
VTSPKTLSSLVWGVRISSWTDLRKDFQVKSAETPLRVETKMFLAGDGLAMEQAIKHSAWI